MSYPAAILRQEIARRLKGECGINVRSGVMYSMFGDKYESCASCPGYCETDHHASGLAGDELEIHVIRRPEDALLSWACPGCGQKTHENADLLKVPSVAKEVGADPLCFTCRTKQKKRDSATPDDENQ